MADGGAGSRGPNPNDAYTVLAYLLSGLIVWGGIGWLADRWLGTEFLVLIGLLVGMGSSMYIVWLRYGKS